MDIWTCYKNDKTIKLLQCMLHIFIVVIVGKVPRSHREIDWEFNTCGFLCGTCVDGQRMPLRNRGADWFQAGLSPDQQWLYYGGVSGGIGLDQAFCGEFRFIYLISWMWSNIVMFVRAGAIYVFCLIVCFVVGGTIDCWRFPCLLLMVLVTLYMSPLVLLQVGKSGSVHGVTPSLSVVVLCG